MGVVVRPQTVLGIEAQSVSDAQVVTGEGMATGSRKRIADGVFHAVGDTVSVAVGTDQLQGSMPPVAEAAGAPGFVHS